MFSINTHILKSFFLKKEEKKNKVTTWSKQLCDPLLGHDPLVEKHWYSPKLNWLQSKQTKIQDLAFLSLFLKPCPPLAVTSLSNQWWHPIDNSGYTAWELQNRHNSLNTWLKITGLDQGPPAVRVLCRNDLHTVFISANWKTLQCKTKKDNRGQSAQWRSRGLALKHTGKYTW